MCKGCEKNEPFETTDYFNKIWFFYRLRKGGYPLEANDLSVDEWIDLGILDDEVAAEQWRVK